RVALNRIGLTWNCTPESGPGQGTQSDPAQPKHRTSPNMGDMETPLVPVTIPDLGAAGLSMRVSAWFVDPGDDIAVGESLLEVLVSGMTCDVPALCAGRLARIDKAIDAPVSPGDTVAWIEPAAVQ